MNGSPAAQATTFELANEFARVRVSLDRNGHDPRLLVENLMNETSILLDAFQLASLTGLTPEQFAAFMDPGPRT